MKWPDNKDFAFTIIDDTDNATVENIRPVYDHLLKNGIKTTKTVWVYPPRDHFAGQCLLDDDYLDYLLDLQKQGVGLQLHNAGSGHFNRDEIISGLEIFREKTGSYPTMHINHANNPDNLHWGHQRYGWLMKLAFMLFAGNKRVFYGDDPDSPHFWGDHAKKHIRYIRNRVFNSINTLRYDPRMPYREKNKPFANYWFSSSDGHTVEEFNGLISSKNINKLEKEKGLCIAYTHFASDFVNRKGELNETFRENINHLANKNAWFVPATQILDYLLEQRGDQHAGQLYLNRLDWLWLRDRVVKKMRFGR